MTGLVRLLAAILGAHIQRDDLPAAELEQGASPGPRHPAGTPEAHFQAHPQTAGFVVDGSTPKRCWACGNEAGFHVDHRPCWDVAPFTRTVQPAVRTFADGGLL